MIKTLINKIIEQSPKRLSPMEREFIGKMFYNHGYVINPYMNNFGIRMNSEFTDHFDDALCQMHVMNGDWILHAAKGTTDPGKEGLLTPCRIEGCAIMKPGQYIDAYEIGMHFKTEALVQRGPISVYRDATKDLKYDYDEDSVMTGLFAVDIHGPFGDGERIGRKSLGCQVYKHQKDFDGFMVNNRWIRDTANMKKFTYTLFDVKDLKL